MATITTSYGTLINYDTFGKSENPPLILIQGMGAHMIAWHHEFCQKLADRGFYVVRFDNRDVGLSQHFPKTPYSLVDMADDTAGLLQALHIPAAHVVGQSLGGMIAQQLTLDHPELVSTLALIYSSPAIDFIVGHAELEERRQLPWAGSRSEAVANFVLNEAPCGSPAYDQDIEWISELGGQMYDRDYDPEGIQRQAAAMNGSPGRTDRLHQISVPTALIHGDGDRLISSDASKLMHSLIPGSTLTVFPGMGHELPRALWGEIIDLLAKNAWKAQKSISPARVTP